MAKVVVAAEDQAISKQQHQPHQLHQPHPSRTKLPSYDYEDDTATSDFECQSTDAGQTNDLLSWIPGNGTETNRTEVIGTETQEGCVELDESVAAAMRRMTDLLESFEASSVSVDDKVDAYKMLLRVMANIVMNPGVEKYRRIRVGNAKLHDKLIRHALGGELFAATGFERQEGNWVFNTNILKQARGCLNSLEKHLKLREEREYRKERDERIKREKEKDATSPDPFRKSFRRNQALNEERQRVLEMLDRDKREREAEAKFSVPPSLHNVSRETVSPKRDRDTFSDGEEPRTRLFIQAPPARIVDNPPAPRALRLPKYDDSRPVEKGIRTLHSIASPVDFERPRSQSVISVRRYTPVSPTVVSRVSFVPPARMVAMMPSIATSSSTGPLISATSVPVAPIPSVSRIRSPSPASSVSSFGARQQGTTRISGPVFTTSVMTPTTTSVMTPVTSMLSNGLVPSFPTYSFNQPGLVNQASILDGRVTDGRVSVLTPRYRTPTPTRRIVTQTSMQPMGHPMGQLMGHQMASISGNGNRVQNGSLSDLGVRSSSITTSPAPTPPVTMIPEFVDNSQRSIASSLSFSGGQQAPTDLPGAFSSYAVQEVFPRTPSFGVKPPGGVSVRTPVAMAPANRPMRQISSVMENRRMSTPLGRMHPVAYDSRPPLSPTGTQILSLNHPGAVLALGGMQPAQTGGVVRGPPLQFNGGTAASSAFQATGTNRGVVRMSSVGNQSRSSWVATAPHTVPMHPLHTAGSAYPSDNLSNPSPRLPSFSNGGLGWR